MNLDQINALKIKKICVNITYKCSMGCVWCDRQLDRLSMDDSHCTPDQLAEMAELVAKTDWPLQLVKVSGGEPLEHPQFLDCLDALSVIPKKKPLRHRSIRISTARKSNLPDLPDGFRYMICPPDEKNHLPFMVSPADLGVRATKDVCRMPTACGVSYDKWGWCFCGVGSVISRTIGPSTHQAAPPAAKMNWDTCQHCIYSLPKGVQHAVQQAVMQQEIEFPSRSYQAVIDKYRELGMTYEKTLHLASANRGHARDSRFYTDGRFAKANTKLTILDHDKSSGGYDDLVSTSSKGERT